MPIPLLRSCAGAAVAIALTLGPAAAQQPAPLFDGRSFTGWEGDLKVFRIQEGAIVGGSLAARVPRNEFLCTTKSYGDFELRMQVKLVGADANSGLQFRSARIPNDHEVSGYQADIGQHYWGSLYDESRRNRTLAGPDAATRERVVKPGEWNDYVVRAEGPRIRLTLNGVETVDYTETDPAIAATGVICAQIHSGPPSEAWYRNITIVELTQAFDVVIAGGRVVDGTGAPWFRADVGITGDRIAAMGDLSSSRAVTRIDAAGQVVAPGFIDLLGQSEFNVLVDSRAASKITQGITTEITGEGASIAPVTDAMKADRKASYDFFGVADDWRTLDEYFARLEKAGTAINIGTFVGSGGLRDYVIGKQDRRATPDEMAKMKALVADAMAQGALGLSSSLQYVPNRFSTTDELVELAKVAAAHGGIYITHQRSEANKVFESIDEVLAIAERADVQTEIWHLKTAYKANWGKMTEVLRRIEAARARGLRVSANIYPYDRASNGLDACLPVWVREGGTEAMLKRLQDPAVRARVMRDMDDPNAPYENQWFGSGGPSGVMLSSVLDPALRKYEGMSFDAIGTAMGKDPREAVMDLVIADKAESSVIISIMRESDVVEAMRTPWVSFDTDSGARAEDGPLSLSKSHPRAWGTFPRILGKYVRQDGVLTLEEAVRKMTSQAAIRVGLTDRGLVRPGLMADLVVFDPATVADVATFAQPNRYSVGVRHVFVNGKAVVADGAITKERPGRPLRGPGYRGH